MKYYRRFLIFVLVSWWTKQYYCILVRCSKLKLKTKIREHFTDPQEGKSGVTAAQTTEQIKIEKDTAALREKVELQHKSKTDSLQKKCLVDQGRAEK